jgi:hypothetical protein
VTFTTSKLLVAAIDFGSYGSGYAFSFKHEFEANPINVSTPLWSPENGGDSCYKTPSAKVIQQKSIKTEQLQNLAEKS